MKKRLVVFAAIFLLTTILYAGPVREGSSIGRSGELVLLHTNDLHNALLPIEGRGGVAQIASFINAIRAMYPNVLLVDAGDFINGSQIFDRFNGEPIIRALGMMGYDAVVLGNHEFDAGMESLESWIELADFSIVSSNILRADGTYLGGNRYLIREYDGFRVGIFGITTTLTTSLSNPDSSLVFVNELEATREVVAILREQEGVDVVIGITHMGDRRGNDTRITSVDLAKSIEGIGVDIIVDGHSHSFFERPVRAGDIWVVTAGARGRFMGFGKISVQNGRMIGFDWVPISISPDQNLSELVNSYLEQ